MLTVDPSYPLYKTRILKNFPGPKPVPYLGILPDMIKKTLAMDFFTAEKCLHALQSIVSGFHNFDVELTQKYGPVVGTYIGHFPSILIADPDMIKEIYVKQFRSFPNRPTFPVVERCTTRLIGILKKASDEGKAVDVEKICNVFALDVICGSTFGIDVNTQDNPDTEIVRMAKYLTTVTFSSPILLLQALFPEVKIFTRKFKLSFFSTIAIDYFVELTKTVVKERKDNNQKKIIIIIIMIIITEALKNILRELINWNKGQKSNDFLQILINAYNENNAKCSNKTSEDSFESYLERVPLIVIYLGITNRDLYANSLMFIIEGFDTTSVGLLFSVYRLAINEECQEKLIEEIDREIGQVNSRVSKSTQDNPEK
ncbi:hypothetical protein KUTeg_017935 [Tegillarca granosa]|uniref:Cytochrome P450 n=1 Tax=Tegillarca granosa TaxID=220873 RepID=A0ABQ9EK92_TEGGR|nr:hypothetical protein KUTeg_017935 [Tegillarca granosa]